jgi:arabinoxylan arabinofuranohydrolase
MKKQVYNPYLPAYEYIPDGEPHVFDERLYIFGSHDRFGGKWYCENDYVTWSAPLSDLSDWRYEGIIYRKDQDKRERNLYAPDVAQGPDGKYYLYYSKDDSSVISVAVCDRPAGQYEYLGDVSFPDGHILGDREGDYFMFDPAILIDEGRIFLYSGSSARGTTTKIKRNMAGCTVTELEKDMVTAKEGPKLILPGSKSWLSETYFEGPSVRKIGKYYTLIYPTRDGSGLHYATSKFPDRDFVQRGRIHSTSNVGLGGHSLKNPAYPLGNSHGGMVEIEGQWYVFDHRMTNRTGFSRQGVAEPVTIAPDGSIAQAEATSCGLNGGPLSDEGIYPAYIACVLMSRKMPGGMRLPFLCPFVTQREEDSEGPVESFISSMGNKSVAGYKYFDFRQTAYTLDIRLRGDAGKILVSTDEEAKEVIGQASFAASSIWQSVKVPVEITEGVHALYFTYLGKGKTDLLQFSF